MPTLSWLTRSEDLNRAAVAPYRLLEQNHGLSQGDPSSSNLIVRGDNLEALKALLPFYAGQVKCIYIDPPYNTGSAFDEYDDNLEHSQWLGLIMPRLELLREMLSEEGSIWVNIDDDEAHYLKVLMDEVFGRPNFIANCIWQKRTSPDGRVHIGDAHDHLLVYGSKRARASFNDLPLNEDQRSAYKNPDDDPLGAWVSTDFTAQGYRPNQMYEITTPSGQVYEPPEGRCWANVETRFLELKTQGRIWFGRDGTSRPRLKNYLHEAAGVKSWTWWSNKEVGHNQEAKKETIALFGAANAFSTPKPERLIQRVLEIATNEDDLVLDSFLGSGTTAAVAHKMKRRYIGIEAGEHAETYCVPRLTKVIEGEDGGVSDAVGWKGGGGFRYCQLGTPIFDEQGHIVSEVSFDVLAAHVWFSETGTPLLGEADTPLLGVYDGRAYALLYNGVLRDRKIDGGNVLTRKTLSLVRENLAAYSPGFAGPLTVYGEQSRLGPGALEREKITFKQTPYDVKARA